MRDDLLRELDKLAPSVDVAASLHLFERSRRRATVAGRFTAAITALGIAGILVGLIVQFASRPDREIATSPISPTSAASTVAETSAPRDGPPTTGPPSDGTEFEVLAVENWGLPLGELDIATTADELGRVTRRIPELEDIDVNFDESFLVVMTVPGCSAPDWFDGFTVQPGRWWEPRFERPDKCRALLAGWTYVVAIDRTTDVAGIRLPADDRYDMPAAAVSVVIPERDTSSSSEGP